MTTVRLSPSGRAIEIAGAATWQTVWETDFSAQPSQVLGSDGTYSIDGQDWELELLEYSASVEVVEGTGLVIDALTGEGGAWDVFCRDQTSLSVPLLDVWPAAAHFTPVRLMLERSSTFVGDEVYEWTTGVQVWGQVGGSPPSPANPQGIGSIHSISDSVAEQAFFWGLNRVIVGVDAAGARIGGLPSGTLYQGVMGGDLSGGSVVGLAGDEAGDFLAPLPTSRAEGAAALGYSSVGDARIVQARIDTTSDWRVFLAGRMTSGLSASAPLVFRRLRLEALMA